MNSLRSVFQKFSVNFTVFASLILSVACLSNIFAQDTGMGAFGNFPIPPMQSKPWVISSTNLPAGLERAVNVLFQSGMADPRGCEYREIEVAIGNL